MHALKQPAHNLQHHLPLLAALWHYHACPGMCTVVWQHRVCAMHAVFNLHCVPIYTTCLAGLISYHLPWVVNVSHIQLTTVPPLYNMQSQPASGFISSMPWPACIDG